MAGVFRFPHTRSELEPTQPNLEYWMDRDRALEDWISSPSFDLFVVVDSEGAGDYTSIKDAIEQVPLSPPTTIYVRPRATAYSDSGRGRVSLRAGLDIHVVSNIPFQTGTQQLAWAFDGFEYTGGGSPNLRMSGFNISGPASTWFLNTSPSTGVSGFHNCTFTGAAAASLFTSSGNRGAHTLRLDQCSTVTMSVMGSGGQIAPNLHISRSSLSLATSSVLLGSGIESAGWLLENSSFSAFTGVTASSAAGMSLTMRSCGVGGTCTLGSGPGYFITGSSFTTLVIDAGSTGGSEGNWRVLGSSFETLTTTGTAQNTGGARIFVTGYTVFANLGSTHASAGDHAGLYDLFFGGAGTHTALTISGTNHHVRGQFSNSDTTTINVTGNNNILWYGARGSITLNNSGSGNQINSAPPSGAAGGDLSGTYPNPTVVDHDAIATGDLHPEYLQETKIDAKGDLLAGTAADTAGRLAVGTDGQVLAADSSATTGLAWSTVENPMSHTNLLSNNQASLEVNTEGWAVGANCTIARATSESSHGTASLELTAT